MALEQLVARMKEGHKVSKQPVETEFARRALHPASDKKKHVSGNANESENIGDSGQLDGPAISQNIGAPRLSEADWEVLSALAAVQIKYGRAAEAIPYLMMLRQQDEQDVEVARLLSIALMKMERWEEARIVIEESKAQAETVNHEAGFALFQSIIAFKQRKFELARNWLKQFRSFFAWGAS